VRQIKMASRLPSPGADNGTWGTILNDFLQVSHTSTGELNTNVVGTTQIKDGSVTNAKIVSADATKINTGVLDAARIPSLSSTYARIDGSDYSGTHDFTDATLLGLPSGPQGAPGLVWRGVYNNATTYATNDAVQYNGASFIATAGVTGVVPGASGAPNAPWQLLAVGPTGSPGIGTAGVISPADLAFKAWACDPAILVPGTRTTLVAGQMNGVLMSLPADTISGISFFVGVAGTVLSNTYVAILDAASGNRLAVTTDVSSTFQSTGLKHVAFTSSFTATAGPVYAVFLVGSGSSMPQLTKFPNTDTAFVNARGPGAATGRIRVGQITVASGLTAIPATNDMSGSSAQNTGMWVGID
jgi:hypothetical protein